MSETKDRAGLLGLRVAAVAGAVAMGWAAMAGLGAAWDWLNTMPEEEVYSPPPGYKTDRQREAEEIEREREWERGVEKRRMQEREYRSQPLIPEPDPFETVCYDVTSIDWDWDNDVLCVNPDGSQFYTSYEGANAAMGY